MSVKKNGPKILLLDIETAPMLGYVWSLWENNVALNQLKQDWHVLSWAAKWLDDAPNKTMYQDQRGKKDISDDSGILKGIWRLLDEADIIITQNGKAFDQKKLNARFILNGMKPPSSYRHIDTRQIAKRHFAFTSNKLEYMTDKLNTKYKKLKHSEFGGFELWTQCLANNPRAWREMERYNKYDVLSLEELYKKLAPWDNSIDFNVYHDAYHAECSCGSKDFQRRGFFYTSTGKYQRYSCSDCGLQTRDTKNMLDSVKKASLRRKAA